MPVLSKRWLVATAIGACLVTSICGLVIAYPPPVGHVNDFAGVMRQDAVTSLEAALVELEQRTGAEVAVATVPTVPDGNIEQAAVDLFKEWGVGKQGADNGVLVLCAVQDRAVRIEVGYGLEPVLPDAVCGRIIREQMVPQFRAGDYSAGLTAGALAVAGLIAQHAHVTLTPVVPVSAPSAGLWWAWGLPLLAFGLIFLVGLIMNRRKYGRWFVWGGGGGSGSGGGSWGGSGGGSGSGGGFGGGSSGGGGASGRW